MAPDRIVRQTVTDSAGRYELRFDAGTGDYPVYIGPLGNRAFRKRVLRAPGSTVIVADARLVVAVQMLAAVQTIADRPSLGQGPAALGGDAPADGVRGERAVELLPDERRAQNGSSGRDEKRDRDAADVGRCLRRENGRPRVGPRSA